MKTNILYIIILLLLPCLLQSCLKDDKELFDELTTIRVSEALTKYKEVLSSSSYGWAVQYYPDANQSYGGYTYVWQFTSSDVTAYFELADKSEDTCESLYQLISDEGPVLTFDTYNKYIHYFAEPSSSAYHGKDGDYEFMLMNLSEDENTIKLKGRRTGNYIYMTRLNENPSDYIDKVVAMSEHTSKNYTVTIGGETVSGKISSRNLSFSFVNQAEETQKVSVAFCYTTSGILLYEPIEINGTSIQEFVYRDDAFHSTVGDVVINL